jgi:hypothetical protein
MIWKTMAVLVARKDISEPMKVGIATAFSIGTELAPSMAILRPAQAYDSVYLCVFVYVFVVTAEEWGTSRAWPPVK